MNNSDMNGILGLLENMDNDVVNNVKNMVDSGNIPDNIKEMLVNLNTKSNKNSASSSDTNASNNNFNVDMETVLKMKSIIDAMNKKDDPRSNLLQSLKPYLREGRKDKLDQYVNLLNMSKIADLMKNDNKENNGNG